MQSGNAGIRSGEPHRAMKNCKTVAAMCLDDGHYGKLCTNSRICEKTGVKKSIIGCCISITTGLSHRRGQGEPRADWGILAENPVASVTEGKEQPHGEQTTMMTPEQTSELSELYQSF